MTPATVTDYTDWEPWEGVLVTLPDQEVLDCVNQYGEVNLASGIEMDDAFYAWESEKGATYTSITGPIHYNYGDWTVMPRDESDLAGYVAGQGCSTTCAELQQEGTEGGVELPGVVVTGPMNIEGTGFWVQDQGGGEWSGMYIYLYDGVSADVTVGDIVDIKGSATDYYDLTEVSVSSSDDIVLTGDTTDAVIDPLSSAPDDWESWESCLLRLEGIGITSEPNSYNEVDTDWGITIDDLIYEGSYTNGATCDYVQGLLTYSYEEWKLLPRDADDISCGE